MFISMFITNNGNCTLALVTVYIMVLYYVTTIHPPDCRSENYIAPIGTFLIHCGCGMYTVGYAGNELSLVCHTLSSN